MLRALQLGLVLPAGKNAIKRGMQNVMGKISDDELKLRFKAKMNGLKLNKKLERDQLEAMIWAFDNDKEYLLDCIYTKPKPFNRKGFEQFKNRWAGPRTSGWKESETVWRQLNPGDDLVKEILDGHDRELKWRQKQISKGAEFVPQWKHPASWLRKRRWEAEFEDIKPQQTNTSYTRCDKTARIIEERDQARQNKCVDFDSIRRHLDFRSGSLEQSSE